MYKLKIEDKNKLFFTSDMHFDHFNICKYCNRPYASRSEMNAKLVENWNVVVPEDGIVVNCGDFTLRHKEDLKEYIRLSSKLNGRQLLIRGNHDMVPICIEPVGNFIAIVDIAEIHADGVKITASHYPLLAYPTDYNAFGHIHSCPDGTCANMDADVPGRLRKTQMDVGVDANNYRPISFNEFINRVKVEE